MVLCALLHGTENLVAYEEKGARDLGVDEQSDLLESNFGQQAVKRQK